MENKGIKLTCKGKKCIELNEGKPYEWEYNGKSKIYASCPKCHGSVKVKKQNE